MRIIDAADSIAGRLSSTVAKMAVDGEQIVIINAEKAVISGSKKEVERIYLEKIHRGSRYHGPYQPKMPDRLLRRIIRGMLPYKKEAGLKALRRIKIFAGTPDEYKDKAEKLSNTQRTSKVKKFVMLGDVVKRIGGKL